MPPTTYHRRRVHRRKMSAAPGTGKTVQRCLRGVLVLMAVAGFGELCNYLADEYNLKFRRHPDR